MWVDRVYAPSVWVEGAIWLPLAAMLCVLLLPRMMGATVGLCWATNMVRKAPAVIGQDRDRRSLG